MSTNIKELFKKSIDRNIEGVVTIGNEIDEKIFQELDEYVVTNEITKHFRTFFRKYRESINNPTSKMGVWITGFFGSGKSHFLKMLGYLLENKSVKGLNAPEFFKEKISDETIFADINMSASSNTKVVIFNIDSKAGSTAKSKPQAIMDVMLRAFNEAIGLSATTPWVADMERELIKENNYETFMDKFFEFSKKEWKKDGRNQAFLNRDNIIKTLFHVREMDEESARKYFDDQVSNFSMTTERFAKIVDDYCKTNKTRVAFLMDEVGQFVGVNTELMLNLQTCVEDLGRFCNGKAWVVVTSQQELKVMVDATQSSRLDFSKIQGRFDTRILLSGANADEVIKKRILDKKEDYIPTLESLFEQNDARLQNLIIFDAKPTWNGYKDKNDFKNVYPFVSYQFELLQKVFNTIREHGMTEGKHLSQNERSLLNAFQESSKSYADKELGVLVPFDDFYQTVDNFIDYDVKTVFTKASQKTSLNNFDLRVLKLLFMIKYVKEMPATLDRIATMMVSNINEDKIALKNKIEVSLKALEEETLIQVNGDIYDFLTNEEQDVNKQINLTAHDEGEIIRTVSQIFYEVILQEQKIKHGKNEFPFNRFIDNHNIGQNNPSNITCKAITGFYEKTDDSQLAMESSGQDVLIIDLQNGNFIGELIRASKISVFKQNHLATMSPSLAAILEKKTLELAERRKRAEDAIKIAIKSANIYSNGAILEIGSKDGKERVFSALKKMVEAKYYALVKVKFSYDSINSIIDELNTNVDDLMSLPSNDANVEAYKDIESKLKTDKENSRISTVKSLIDHFGKSPYGWREYDLKGIIGVLWKYNKIKLEIHGKSLSIDNQNDKLEFAKGNKTDSIAVKLQKSVDEKILNEVKGIIRRVFNENIDLNEEKLRKTLIQLLSAKVEALKNIQIKNEGKKHPGKNRIIELHRELSSMIKSDDSEYIFSQVITKKDYLEENSDYLDEIISFYQHGSAQLKNYLEAEEMYLWYQNNRMLEDLSQVDDLMNQMIVILSDENPFGKMVVLGQLVVQAKQIKDKIRQEKINKTLEVLNKDLNLIREEAIQAKAKLQDQDKLHILEDTINDIEAKYNNLFNSIQTATNLDQYITSSTNNVDGFKRLVKSLFIEQTPGKKTKAIKLSNLVPIANKKITSKEDIEKIVSTIKSRLIDELTDTDEINID